MKNIILGLLLLLTASCSSKIDVSEIDDMVVDVRINNEMIFNQISDEPPLNGDEADLKNMISVFHRDVNAFIDSVDIIEDDVLEISTRKLMQRTFLKYPLEYPTDLKINLRHRSTIKLQLATLESTYLRESNLFNVVNTIRMDSILAIVIPDKVVYKRGERITGKVSLAVYAKEIGSVNAKVSLNDRFLEIKNGKAAFSFVPEDNGLRTIDLTGKIDLGGQIFSSSAKVLIED